MKGWYINRTLWVHAVGWLWLKLDNVVHYRSVIWESLIKWLRQQWRVCTDLVCSTLLCAMYENVECWHWLCSLVLVLHTYMQLHVGCSPKVVSHNQTTTRRVTHSGQPCNVNSLPTLRNSAETMHWSTIPSIKKVYGRPCWHLPLLVGKGLLKALCHYINVELPAHVCNESCHGATRLSANSQWNIGMIFDLKNPRFPEYMYWSLESSQKVSLLGTARKNTEGKLMGELNYTWIMYLPNRCN